MMRGCRLCVCVCWGGGSMCRAEKEMEAATEWCSFFDLGRVCRAGLGGKKKKTGAWSVSDFCIWYQRHWAVWQMLERALTLRRHRCCRDQLSVDIHLLFCLSPAHAHALTILTAAHWPTSRHWSWDDEILGWMRSGSSISLYPCLPPSPTSSLLSFLSALFKCGAASVRLSLLRCS